MTDQEKRIATGAGVIALLMLLFPPWQTEGPRNVTINMGYHFIATGPDIGEVAITRLLVQLAVVGVVAFGAAKLLRRR